MNEVSNFVDIPQWLEGLTDEERNELKLMLPEVLFAISSWGCSATLWTSSVLNSHPDICCMHESNVILKSFGYSSAARLEGLDYMRALISFSGGRTLAVGDVRGFEHHHIKTFKGLFGDLFRCAVLVREPLARIKSQMQLFHKFKDIQDQTWDVSYLSTVIDNDLLTSAQNMEDKLFIHACNMLNTIISEQEIGKIFRVEDITKNPKALGELVRTVTGGKVPIKSGWLKSSVEKPKINIHNEKKQDEPFNKWQVHVLQKVVKPEAIEAYIKLGYHWPFRKDESKAIKS